MNVNDIHKEVLAFNAWLRKHCGRRSPDQARQPSDLVQNVVAWASDPAPLDASGSGGATAKDAHSDEVSADADADADAETLLVSQLMEFRDFDV